MGVFYNREQHGQAVYGEYIFVFLLVAPDLLSTYVQ